jgi:acyl carrier protein
MLPAQIVRVDEFELTPNGKVNHRRLPAPDNTRPELNNPFEPARTPIEESVAQIVSELLKVQPVGIHDSFFELGGDSLQAARLLSRIDDVFGIEITLADFYTSPTVASANLLITQPDNTSNEEVDLATALRMLGEF